MRLLYNLHDHRFSSSSSSAYNRHEQDQAISSAETQVSIANGMMRSAASGLTIRANALVVAANNYVDRMNKLTSKIASGSSSSYLSSAGGSKTAESKADVSESRNSSYHSEASLSKAPRSSASVGKVLVSLKSNVGTIYSLVNDRNSSNQN